MGPVEAAKFLQVSLSSVQRWIDSGAIPAHRTLGGHRRIRFRDLLAFAEARSLPLAWGSTVDGTPEVLLVDDDPDVVEALDLRIRALRPDVEVLKASNGFDAGLLVSRRAPALVLLDIRLPGIDGIEVCRSLKANPETARTRIVGITGTRRREEIEALRAAGAEDVLLKPIEKETIRSVLDRYVPRAAAARAAGAAS